MPKNYSCSAGTFTFPGETCSLRLSRVEKNRYGHLFADVAVLTPDGQGYLAQDHGELSSDRFRQAMAASAAKRNSGTPILLENLLMEAYLAVKDDPAVTTAVPRPVFTPASDFARRQLPELPEVVEDLIAPGRLYVLGAKPKSGKTLLLMTVGLAVAGGQDILGRRVRPGRVAFFQLEDSERTIQKRLRAMCPQGVPGDLLLHMAPFRLVEENFQDTLASLKGCCLVICDPVVQAMEIKDWNAQDEVRKGYDLWRRLARESDAAVILSAHHRKMEGGEFGDNIAGSVQATATVDGILDLARSKDLDKTERRLSYLGRDWGEIEDQVISLNPNTLTWELKGTFREAQDTAKQERLQEIGQKVWEALPSQPPGKTNAELEAATGLNRNQLKDGLEALADKVGRGGKPRSKTSPLCFWRRA